MHGLIDTGTVELYHEVRGSGAPLLLITGGTGDAGEWSGVAPVLGEQFTVITYDRRGMSRSPKVPGSAAMSMSEQADDAAGLLRALVQEPALVVGHSGGASIACSLVVRHRELLRHAVLYEPPLLAIVPDGDAVVAGFQAADRPGHGRGRAEPRARAVHAHQRGRRGRRRGADVHPGRGAGSPPRKRRGVLRAGAADLRRVRPRQGCHARERRPAHGRGGRRQPRHVVRRRGAVAGGGDGRGPGGASRRGHAGVFTHSEAFIALVRTVAGQSR